MPRTHNLSSPAFAALIDAWANRWVLGQELSEAIVAEAATAALNKPETELAKREGREPDPSRLVKFGTMRDRFGHLVRIGAVSTRDRGDTRQTALSMNFGTPGNEGSATLRDGLAAYLADPIIGTSAKNDIVSALRFIMRPTLASGQKALLEEAERYGADQLALLLAQVDREWQERQRAAESGMTIPGRGPVSVESRGNRKSTLKQFLIWAGKNGHVPMIATGEGSIAWHESIARWFGQDSGLDERTRSTYAARMRELAKLLAECFGVDRPDPAALAWTHIETVLETLYQSGRPRVMPRVAHIANAMAKTNEVPGMPPRVTSVIALEAERGSTPHTWVAFDEFLGTSGLAHDHPLRAFLRYHGVWCTRDTTDRTMSRRRERQRMDSELSERRRIGGLRTWLGMVCKVHKCSLADLSPARAFAERAEEVVDELIEWWRQRVEEEEVSSLKSQGLKTFLVAGEQAMALLKGVLDLDEHRTESLAWLPAVRHHERRLRQSHTYVRDQLDDLAKNGGEAPVLKNLDTIIELTGPLWWMRIRDEAIGELRGIMAAVTNGRGGAQRTLTSRGKAGIAVREETRIRMDGENKELLERAHDLFALLLVIATMSRGREYTTVRLDRQASSFSSTGRIDWRPTDTKNDVAKTGIADGIWLPTDLRRWFLDDVRPTLIRLGTTLHKNHAWLLLVPGTGAPLGDPNEREVGKGVDLKLKRNEKLVTQNLHALRHRLWCLTVELACAVREKDPTHQLPPRDLYGALTLHAIRACMSFAGCLVHSIEVAAALLGDTTSTTEKSYASLRVQHLQLKPRLIQAGYTLPNEQIGAGAPAQPIAAAIQSSSPSKTPTTGARTEFDYGAELEKLVALRKSGRLPVEHFATLKNLARDARDGLIDRDEFLTAVTDRIAAVA